MAAAHYRDDMSITAPKTALTGEGPDSAAGRGGPASALASSWRRPPPDRSGRQADLIGAAALFAGSMLSMTLLRATGFYDDPAGNVISVVVLALLTLPLIWRRQYPCTVLVLVAAAMITGGELMVSETLVTNIAVFTALYTAGAWAADRRRSMIVRTSVIAVMFVWLISSFFRIAADPPDDQPAHLGVGMLTPLAAYFLLQFAINVLYFAGATWFGNASWAAARDRALLEQRAHQLQAERALVEAQAVTIERMRVARELHDAVAHHVSLMGIQAAAARTLLTSDPDNAPAALERVEDSARAAIAELHTLLRMLRQGPDEPGDGVGSLGVNRIDGLIDDAREAGLSITMQIVGEPAELRPVASLNLYRIAQEALTNVRKHAGSHARVDVRLRYLPDAVELEVADDGAGRRRRTLRQGSGRLGLVGMRERAEAERGTLHAGPRRDGGFIVRAQIPYQRPDGPEGAP